VALQRLKEASQNALGHQSEMEAPALALLRP
jgi:hypothetical protein